ncbi:unnamed protein product [Rotaria sp. Silwood2]|nr:unnamed protein product [Rotaria sp. Silwood2]
MIEMDLHDKNYFDACQHYKHYYDTPRIKQDEEKMKQSLKYVVLYLALSPYNNEQSDFLHRLFLDKNLEQIPKYKDVLQRFKTQELIHWKDILKNFKYELKNDTKDDPVTNVFTNTDDGKKRWKDFKVRVVEHNMRIMAKYYTRARTQKMAELLDLTKDEAEQFLSNLVSTKTISAKIDRLQDIVTFQQKKSPQEILNDWSVNLNSLMTIINKTCHLINKEKTVHALYYFEGCNAIANTIQWPKPIASSSTAQAISDLISRVLDGVPIARLFQVSINTNLAVNGKDIFELSNGSMSGSILISASSGVAAAWGFNYYLKYVADSSFYWSGKNIRLTGSSLIPISTPIRIVVNDLYRWYGNPCTFSYSAVFLEFFKVFLRMGFPQSELDEYFTGPAFLAW